MIVSVDFALTDAERELAELCRDFAQKEIARRAPRAWDEAQCPTDLLREMGELVDAGVRVLERAGRSPRVPHAAAWQAHVTIGSLPLYLFGTDEQRGTPRFVVPRVRWISRSRPAAPATTAVEGTSTGYDPTATLVPVGPI